MKRFWVISMGLMLMTAVQSCAQDSLSLKLVSSNLITDLVGYGQYSGITYLGGTHYAVVHDKLGGGGIVFFDIHFREDGTVAFIAKNVPPGTEGTGIDSEGIAYVPSTRTLFVSAEADQSIREYDLKGYPTGRKLAIPADLGTGNITPNQGFEALTYSARTHLFWTVTEGPLLSDGDNLLRLQSFGEDLEPAGRSGRPPAGAGAGSVCSGRRSGREAQRGFYHGQNLCGQARSRKRRGSSQAAGKAVPDIGPLFLCQL